MFVRYAGASGKDREAEQDMSWIGKDGSPQSFAWSSVEEWIVTTSNSEDLDFPPEHYQNIEAESSGSCHGLNNFIHLSMHTWLPPSR